MAKLYEQEAHSLAQCQVRKQGSCWCALTIARTSGAIRHAPFGRDYRGLQDSGRSNCLRISPLCTTMYEFRSRSAPSAALLTNALAPCQQEHRQRNLYHVELNRQRLVVTRLSSLPSWMAHRTPRTGRFLARYTCQQHNCASRRGSG